MIGMPRSLRGRTLLLTVIGIIACEAVTFAVLGVYRHTLLAGRARDFVGGQIEMVRTALAHATPEQVSQELDRPRRNRALLVPPEGTDSAPRLQRRTRNPSPDATQPDKNAPASPPDDEPQRGNGPPLDDNGTVRARGTAGGPPRGFPRMHLVEHLPANATTTMPDDLALPQVVTSLRDEYGADALRFTDEPEPAVWVRMPPNNWWLMLPFARYSSPPIPWSILLATLAAVAVMGGFVGLYSFHLARPLRALSDAAARYKVGQHPELPLTGPDEIRAVTRQFNAMADRLERDDAERRVMLAGLPHDLRAPLSRARLRLELMDDGADSPKLGLQRDLAEVGRIADQFVAYLRGLDNDISGFRSAALHEIVRDRGLVWRESGHDVTIERADPFTREVDADALMRAVDNLIGNAFAHGAAPVSIAGIADAPGPRAAYRIIVRDHGPGIPAAQRDEALQPFTRLDLARGASGHCGLGLAVAQSIARLHGGEIELDDVAGGGLAASLVLPQQPTRPAS
jgi:two-component system, OmpR family, osmolarity sensor histidine kinase EnvZ